MDKQDFGLNDYFIKLAEAYKPLKVGRVITQEKGRYRIISEFGERYAVVSGKFEYHARCNSDFPAVGDFVMFDPTEHGEISVIHHVLKRKSVFLRKSAGIGKGEQVVAANIDTVFICMSLNQDFNIRRLERYLAAVYDSGAMPIIVFTKSDLCEDIDSIMDSLPMEISIATTILVTNSLYTDGFEVLFKYLQKGKTVAFVGSSGVGKSTLINRLSGNERIQTGGLRNDDKGRHTTTHRELIFLGNGAMVIDTPGMRELGMWENEAGIDTAFSDIEKFAPGCRFKNCTHNNEPGCAVQEAIQNGILSEERFLAYVKLKQENEYAADSKKYLEAKKMKFKKIAKINKINQKS